MASSADDLILGFKAQVGKSAIDLNPFMTPCPWNEQKFLQMTEEEERNKIKIGILQESINLPLSDATKRAIKKSEQKLRELGYLVVPFFLTDEVWQQARDY